MSSVADVADVEAATETGQFSQLVTALRGSDGCAVMPASCSGMAKAALPLEHLWAQSRCSA